MSSSGTTAETLLINAFDSMRSDFVAIHFRDDDASTIEIHHLPSATEEQKAQLQSIWPGTAVFLEAARQGMLMEQALVQKQDRK